MRVVKVFVVVNVSKVATASIVLDEAKPSSSIHSRYYIERHAYEAGLMCSSSHSPPMIELAEDC